MVREVRIVEVWSNSCRPGRSDAAVVADAASPA